HDARARCARSGAREGGGRMASAKGEPFEAVVAVGQDWHFIDTMGSVVVADGRVVLRRADGEVIAEALAREGYATRWLFATRLWIGGKRYSIERPKASPSAVKGGVRRTRKLTREFLRAFETAGGQLGKPPDQ